MSNTAKGVVPATAAPSDENQPKEVIAHRKATPFITQGSADNFDVTAVEDMLDVMEQVRNKDIAKSEVASINMVTRYLKFTQHKDQPIRRFFMGWTARPLVDYKTKEPLTNPDTGEQLFGPAVIFYNPEKQQMEVNQAFDIIKTFHDTKPPQGTAVEITFKGLITTDKGNNKQDFSIVFLK